jgi:hypothetical protein
LQLIYRGDWEAISEVSMQVKEIALRINTLARMLPAKERP